MFLGVKSIECGVKQCGVPSPCLFSCYINDVPLADGAQVKFSKAANVSTDDLDLKLYSLKISFDYSC